ncbi:MAG: hypothetical protein A3F31_04095 [Candidatus Levybacteria bacterium RIFCSPHIGHO2_12_FULL_38_12]|nr:MAG: hypothetical protein A3F31_04095 [Candidatus Levybacteria bacterium RIFCSPHIGHO2_12_FULL_38_12]OGH34379.1 MAG: hypothetical protein A3A47_04490 [Candidatus Levybacteria bacterium RIFCSPLOWO2_01_FULL_37_20]OGH44436.1 MAG: hypothetical protein A3J14_03220 [Candidatus Levybacteria bacterium RIFCSPLOWO2_02_FULL_37_18]
MKILLVHNFYKYKGGEDVYFLSLADLLKRKGHQVKLFTKENKDISDSLVEKAKAAGGMFWNRKVEDEFSETILQFKPEVVHLNNIYPLISPSIYKICKKFNVPTVQTIHNYRFPHKGLFFNNNICAICGSKKTPLLSIFCNYYNNSFIASFIFTLSFFFYSVKGDFNLIDMYVFPAKITRNYYIKKLGLSLDKTTVINHFVGDNDKLINFKQKKDYFLFVGRFSEEKGIMQLLEIFSRLSTVKLVVIGDGPLKEKVAEYSRYKNILIRNFLSSKQVFKYMGCALCAIVPSLWYEVGPLVVLESFANGTPVLVPSFGVFKERVKNGKGGLFFQYNNDEDLQVKILHIWNNKALFKKLNKVVRMEYESKYSAEKHYNSLLKIYEGLVIEK